MFTGAGTTRSVKYGFGEGGNHLQMDRNADGLTDLNTHLNTGNGLKQVGSLFTLNRHGRTMDFNGDGRPDSLNAKASGSDPWMAIHINTGLSECVVRGNTGDPTGDCEDVEHPRLPWGRHTVGGAFETYIECKDAQGVVQPTPSDVVPRKETVACPDNANELCFGYNYPGRDPNAEVGAHNLLCQQLDRPPGEDSDDAQFLTTQVMDWNGDGLSDVVLVDRQSGNVSVWVQNGTKTDLLQMVEDGRGAKTRIHYQPSTSSIVTAGTEACGYPYDCVNRGMWLVRFVDQDSGLPDPDAAPVRDAYTYADGRSDLLGRGWLGFKSRTVRRSIGGSLLETATTRFDRAHEEVEGAFPYRMMPTYQETVLARSGVGSAQTVETTFAPLRRGVAGTAPGSNQSIFRVDTDGVTKVEYETRNLQPLSSRYKSRVGTFRSYDAYGNVTYAQTTTLWWDGPETQSGTIHRSAADRRFTRYEEVPDPAVFAENAYLGLMVQTEEYSQFPPSEEFVGPRRQTFVPDVARAVISSRTVQPGGGPDQQVRETYTRDPVYGQIIRVDVADLNSNTRFTTTSFDPIEHMFPEESINSAGHRTRTFFHPAFGVPIWSSDSNGRVARLTYDSFGRAKGTDGPLQADSTVSYSRDASYSLIVTMTSDAGPASRQGFDRLGRQTLTSSRAFDGSWVDTTTTYSAESLVTSKAGPYGTTTFLYDGLRRLTQTSRADDDPALGMVGNWDYDLFFKVTKTAPRKATQTEATRNKTYVVSDPFGRTVETGELAGATWVKTNYSYKPFGPLEKVTSGPSNNRIETVYDYDVLGRRTSLTSPDSGTTTWTYTAFGEPATETDQSGRVVVMRYDSVGRMEQRRFGMPASSPMNTYTFDTAPNGIGQLATATSLDGVIRTYEYDLAFGAPAAETLVVPGENDGRPMRQSQSYDSFGRPATLTYPMATARTDLLPMTVSYGYGANGALQKVDQTGPATRTIWEATRRESLGRIEEERLDNGTITSTRAYNENTGRLGSIDTRSAGEVFQNLRFEYDPDSSLKAKRDLVEGLHEGFLYDDLDRLQTWQEIQPNGLSPRPGGFQVAYDYDDHGNLRTRAATGGVGAQSVTYRHDRTNNAGPHAASSTTLWSGDIRYDLVGNVIQHPQAGTITYTPFNLPRNVAGPMPAAYLYDAADRRVRKVSGGRTTLYFGGTYERRAEGGDRIHLFSVSNGDRVVAQVTRSDVTGAEETSFLHADPLGSTDAVSGANAGRTRRDPFGNRIARDGGGNWDVRLSGGAPMAPGLSAVTVGFTGHEQEDDLGLINMRGRITIRGWATSCRRIRW